LGRTEPSMTKERIPLLRRSSAATAAADCATSP
jgi:hypothetical protein